jgi:hypothetical protein
MLISVSFGRTLRDSGLLARMDSRGDAHNNAYREASSPRSSAS